MISLGKIITLTKNVKPDAVFSMFPRSTILAASLSCFQPFAFQHEWKWTSFTAVSSEIEREVCFIVVSK